MKEDPELMDKLPQYPTKAFFHEKYLREMLKEYNIKYKKSKPKEVLERSYFDELQKRVVGSPNHLQSLQTFFKFCASIRSKLWFEYRKQQITNNLKTPYLHFLLLYLWLLPSNDVKAQSPSYIHYSTQHGLPSNEVYSILQDSKGYIWLATAMGATRFNGRTFTTYNTSNGLSNKQVLDIREDSLRRLWVLTVDGKTSYWRKGAFKEAQTVLFGEKQLRAGDIIIDYKTSLLFHRDSLEQDILPDPKDYSISCSYVEDKKKRLGRYLGRRRILLPKLQDKPTKN